MRTLLVGYTASDLFERGKHGKTFTAPWVQGDVTCHCLDIYHRHAIEKVHHVKAICSPHLPEGPWDVIKFKTGPRRMSGELTLDLFQEISKLLDGDLRPPRFELVYEGKERDRNALLNKVTGNAARERSFAAAWQASVPGLEPITLTSFPGCFCHRRVDEGGLALAEVVCRDLMEGGGSAGMPLPAILDMGCGSGLVGLLIASRLGASGATGTPRPTDSNTQTLKHSNTSPFTPNNFLTLVDSHSRAVEAATLNAKSLGIEAEVILSDNGTPARLDGTFDVFVGNPPYYSDYRIADVFLETAQRALKPGGVCYTVCKNAAGLEPVQKKYFPEVEIFKRRGYAVLKSTKKEGPL